MEPKSRRTAEEMRQLVSDYKQSGMTRRQYCEQHGITVTALAYHYTQERKRSTVPGLVKVLVKAPKTEPVNGFTLVLGNGRRIESGWRFEETELAKVIRVAEAE